MHLLWRHWQATTSTNPQGSTVEHAYDAAGNLVRTTRAANTGGSMVTALTYDLRGRKLTLSDPDTGNYGYTYNGFGELIRQTDGKNQPTDSLYDKLGRITQRSANGELISNYTYDTCTKGLGKLCTVTAKGSASPSGSNATVGHSRTLSYDSVGRLSGETTLIGAKTYTASTDFDLAGRVKTINYPNGQFVTRLYDEVGAWKQLLGSNGQPLWTGGNADAEARWLNWTTGLAGVSELTTSTSFGTNTGRLASLATSNSVQTLGLTYDGFGNIRTRLDAVNGYHHSNGTSTPETFAYDTLNQLTQANFKEGPQNITYDGFGRINTKTGVNAVSGSYQYLASNVNGSSTTNRIQAANARGYTYDGNGNVDTISSSTGTSAGQAAGTITLSWTAFNQPLALPVAAAQNAGATATGNANAVITLKYGADHQRVLEQLPRDDTVTGANQTAYRYVLHSGASLFYEEDVRNDGTIEQRAYLTGPLGVVAVHTTNSDGVPTVAYPLGSPVTPTGQQLNAQNNNGTPYTLTYWHRDHLGSLTVTTDETGQVKERLRFDPWGKPMPGTYANGIGSKTRTGDRGFTGHEHLAGGLIHMNGRIYDPVLGRFLSADIVVQFPSAITSYNRYAYVMNNPLAFTDPSGYFIDVIIAFVIANATYFAAAAVLTSGVQSYRGNDKNSERWAFAAIFIATAGAPAGLMTSVMQGFALGGLQSGSIDGAVAGAMSAGLFYGVGSLADSAMHAGMGDYMSTGAMGPPPPNMFISGGIGRAGMHAIAGCAMGAASGGGCGRGAASAGFAELAGPLIPGGDGPISKLIGKSVVGGLSSVLGGGKFGNGAATAAFGFLFNQLAHASREAAASTRLKTALSDLGPEYISPGVDVNENIRRAQTMGPKEYYETVKSFGEWDYKQLDRRYEDFGNFNFGATCSAQTFSSTICSAGAGAYQIKSGTSDPKWGGFFGSSWGDDPVDQRWISNGQEYYRRFQTEFMWNFQPRKRK